MVDVGYDVTRVMPPISEEARVEGNAREARLATEPASESGDDAESPSSLPRNPFRIDRAEPSPEYSPDDSPEHSLQQGSLGRATETYHSQALQLAVPLKVSRSLTMSSWWTACDYCCELMKVYDTTDFDFDQEGIYCADCCRWWHDEICWPVTMDCILMLATKSLQDNPK